MCTAGRDHRQYIARAGDAFEMRISQASVVIDAHNLEITGVLHDEFQRRLRILRTSNGVLKYVDGETSPVDRDDLHAVRDARRISRMALPGIVDHAIRHDVDAE